MRGARDNSNCERYKQRQTTTNNDKQRQTTTNIRGFVVKAIASLASIDEVIGNAWCAL